MILVNVSIRFPDNCLSYSLKLVVDQVKGKCTQFPLCQPAFSSSKYSHVISISLHPSCHKTIARRSWDSSRRQESLQAPFSFPHLGDYSDFRLCPASSSS